MAHKKGEGSTQNNRDSQSKRLGIKLYGGQTAKAGSIIIRQRGLRYGLGENVYIGKDFTVHAMIPGKVMFKKGKDDKTIVYIQPFTEVAETVATVKGAKPAKAAAAPKAKAPAKAVAATPAPAPKAAVVEVAPAVEEVVAAAPAAVVAEIVAAAPAVVESATKSDDDDFSFDSIEAAFDEPAAEPVVAKAAATGKPDDLTKIEGIGPKIAELFHNEGIHLFSELANTPVERMREILDAAGPRYRIHEPATWAQQANLAATGQWAELKELQDRLDGGKEG